MQLRKAVSPENIKKVFKKMLFSLNPDVSEDSTEGSRRLNELIADATAFEDLSEEYKIKVSFAPLKMIVCTF